MKTNKLIISKTFPIVSNDKGDLTFYQHGTKNNEVDFPIERVLFIRGMKENDVRGGHTHHKTEQIIFCIKGSCVVSLDDGKEKASFLLNNPSIGLVLKPYVWHTMHSFKEDSELLVFASTSYDEKDYIRNYEDFMRIVQKK
jgi:dTDP-4-dehydrorhamnose 3,5-epimerase-like enzyme